MTVKSLDRNSHNPNTPRRLTSARNRVRFSRSKLPAGHLPYSPIPSMHIGAWMPHDFAAHGQRRGVDNGGCSSSHDSTRTLLETGEPTKRAAAFVLDRQSRHIATSRATSCRERVEPRGYNNGINHGRMSDAYAETIGAVGGQLNTHSGRRVRPDVFTPLIFCRLPGVRHMKRSGTLTSSFTRPGALCGNHG